MTYVIGAQRFTEADLIAKFDALPRERLSYGQSNFTAAQIILVEFLGFDWWGRNVWAGMHDMPRKRTFFGLDFSSDEVRESKTQRVLDLAEILFNLQHIDGFDECLVRLRTGNDDQIEATFAELQVGKLLHSHSKGFRFVPRAMLKSGTDYDYEIAHPNGETVCGEAKCKLEAGNINPAAVLGNLRKAVAQLPKDRPGIIFVKIPQHWFEGLRRVPAELRLAVGRLKSQRVVSVVFYVPRVTMQNNTVSQRHYYDELPNKNTRHNANLDWRLFAQDGADNWLWLMDITARYRKDRLGRAE